MTNVKDVFESISGKYDLLDSFISLGMDQFWRKRAVNLLEGQDFSVILDNGSGTGRLASEIQRAFPSSKFLVLDLTESMLARNSVRDAQRIVASADRVPLPDASVDLITAAFLTRNVPDLNAYLREAHRLLRPGGTLLNLDIFMPSNWFSPLFACYFFRLVPFFGDLVTGSRSYSYLASSVRKFVSPVQFSDMLAGAGFSGIHSEPHAMGSVWIHVGNKHSDA